MLRSCSLFALVLLLPVCLLSNTNRGFDPAEYLKFQDQFRHHIGSNSDSALAHCATMRKSGVPEYIVYAYAAEAYVQTLLGNRQAERNRLEKAYKHLRDIPSQQQQLELKATVLNFEGSIFKHNKEYTRATEKYLAGQAIAQSSGNIPLEIRFIHNLADIKAAIGDLRAAIQQTKKELRLLESSKNMFTSENYAIYRSNTLINLGKFYNDWYHETNKPHLLDSAQHYYTRALAVSNRQDFNSNLIRLNLGGIALTKKDYHRAIQSFRKVLSFSEKNNLHAEQKKAVYNLAIASYEIRSYKQALKYFKQVDEFYHADSTDLEEYIKSNYFQSIIYRQLNEKELAYKHSDIYLENYARFMQQRSDQKIHINDQLTRQHYKQEMEAAQQSYKRSFRYTIWIVGILLVLATAATIYIVRRNRKIRLAAKANADTTNTPVSTTPQLKLDSAIEQELLQKLRKLETDQFFLRQDFSLQTVSKRMKTNTTYLSHVVNQHFNKTFSEYSNDLKIGYVIKKMIEDSRYREFSTQAIAESVGFKNAASFTRSFSKKTGMTPYQFSILIREKGLKTVDDSLIFTKAASASLPIND